MAQQRRPSQRASSVIDNSLIARRKLQSRRGLISRRRVFTLNNSFHQPPSNSHASVASTVSPPDSPRAVLIPVHFNLRRLPSRVFVEEDKEEMRDAVQAGTKRKRVASGSENTLGQRRGSRAGHRVKRRRGLRGSSEEDDDSSMEIDDESQWQGSDSEGEEDDTESSNYYLIHAADRRQLLRLRKDELVELYGLAGLADDGDALTKHELADCIIDARDDIASLPPSSPPGAGDSGSSDYSSDGGNIAGGEETDYGSRFRSGLKRRATINEVGPTKRRTLGSTDRCYSMSQMEQVPHYTTSRYPATQPSSLNNKRRRSGSTRSSPTHSSGPLQLPSPPATRLRTRTMSNGSTQVASSSSAHKGKRKQVGFREETEVQPMSEQESDLTDLDTLEEEIRHTSPSPRRLRSQGSREHLNGRAGQIEDLDLGRRVTPMRNAKRRTASMKEDSTDEEEDELEESDAEEYEDGAQLITPVATPTPIRVRRTPMIRRLRPRRTQQAAPASDGDDEGSDEENGEVEESVDGDDDDDTQGDDDDETVKDESDGEVEVEVDEDDREETVVEPRVLRNGKVVGEFEEVPDSEGEEDAEGEPAEDVEEDIDLGGEEDDEEDEEEDVDEQDGEGEVDAMDDGDSQADDAASVDLDAEGEEVDAEEAMDDEVDLTIATQKSLIRLKRDDLVRLCENREIEASGTKPQLAEALLEWRDTHCSESASSPSSTGTARPPSTTKPRRRQLRSSDPDKTPPVLYRSERVHLDEPRTPPFSGDGKDGDGELELDLESLGLEDREIPPEKITKLEKIGSGGFKDVFIGKFKGRKVAIAEFRGQLGPMDIKELKLLGDFNHPNIVRFIGVSIPVNTRETPVMIVSELCSNGDLFDYIRNVEAPTLYRVLCIMLDIARGLEYLHTRKPSVIHRDCKSSNILITSKGVAKITDFGLAKVKQSARSMVQSVVGTVNWQAPELWHPHPKYNHKADVFSCAMVFWEMLQWHLSNKKFPWEGMNEHAIYDIVGQKHQRPSVHGLRGRWCPEIVDLIERMWVHDPTARPTMSEVVEELEELVHTYR